MKLDKAIEILDLNVREAGKKMPPDTLEALKLGYEALKHYQLIRDLLPPPEVLILPGEDSFIDTSRSEHHIKEVLESPPGTEPK